MTGLLGALQFLTRIPIRTRAAVPHHRIVAWFPVAGLMIGLVVGGLAAGLHQLVPPVVAAATVIAVGMMLTGAFHEDGLADVADAFGGGWTRDERFEILEDSRHGTYGVAAMSASIVIRVAAVGSLTTGGAAFGGLVAANVLARTSIVGALLTIRPATDNGLGADTARAMRRSTGWMSVVAGLALSAAIVGWWIGPLAASAATGTAAVGWLAVRKIGGIVGDVLGAVEQVVECAVLVVVSGLAARNLLWWQ